MKISEMIHRLETLMDDHGDLPVATERTESSCCSGSEQVFEVCKADYLSVKSVDFTENEYVSVKGASGEWVKVVHKGLHLVIDAI